ncbi:hypothetical protein GTW46_26360 [Streptomyces sp. SID6013]|nr:hypothetical protein [Streptomyces sp. SID6013]
MVPGQESHRTVGHNFTLTSLPCDGRSVAVLQADELAITNGALVPRRRLNGDETGANTQIRIAAEPSRIHGFMPASGLPSGVVRFSVYFLPGPLGLRHDRASDRAHCEYPCTRVRSWSRTAAATRRDHVARGRADP